MRIGGKEDYAIPAYTQSLNLSLNSEYCSKPKHLQHRATHKSENHYFCLFSKFKTSRCPKNWQVPSLFMAKSFYFNADGLMTSACHW